MGITAAIVLCGICYSLLRGATTNQHEAEVSTPSDAARTEEQAKLADCVEAKARYETALQELNSCLWSGRDWELRDKGAYWYQEVKHWRVQVDTFCIDSQDYLHSHPTPHIYGY